MKKFYFFILMLGLSLSACNYRRLKNGGGAGVLGDLNCTPISFVKVSTEVFGTGPGNPGRCFNCHNSGLPNAGISVEGYQDAFANSKAILSAVQGNRMPKGAPLNAALKQIVQTWVNQGAPESDELAILDPKCPPPEMEQPPVDSMPVDPIDPIGQPVDPVDPGPVVEITPDFESINANVFSKKCNFCHEEGSNKYAFTSYNLTLSTAMELFTADSPEKTRFVQSLLPEAPFGMPMGGAPLSESEVRVITEWIRAGLPEKQSAPVVVH